MRVIFAGVLVVACSAAEGQDLFSGSSDPDSGVAVDAGHDAAAESGSDAAPDSGTGGSLSPTGGTGGLTVATGGAPPGTGGSAATGGVGGTGIGSTGGSVATGGAGTGGAVPTGGTGGTGTGGVPPVDAGGDARADWCECSGLWTAARPGTEWHWSCRETNNVPTEPAGECFQCPVDSNTRTYSRLNCDGIGDNWCETKAHTDPQNCGACGHVCSSGVCVDGKCAT